MRLMTLNVLLGGEERFGALLDVLAAARPDVLVLEECVGWDDGARLSAVAEAIGVPAGSKHLVNGRANARPSGKRYNVCLVSRAPIERSRVLAPESVAHCIIEASILQGAPLLILGAHLASASEDARLVETTELLSLAPSSALASGDVALCGDLNALTRRDPYPSDLAERLVAAGIDKYGHPPRFDVMDRLLGAGWIDALSERPASARWATARRERRGVSIDTRTDYVLLSPGLARRLVSADVIDVGSASDHHAVVCDLRA